MKWSETLIPTLKELPSDAECISHKLMLRAGLIRKLSSGTYSYLPMGVKVLRKVEDIVRQEMDRAGALEVLLPALQPAEIWKESGRYEELGDDMLKAKDRHGREIVFGPTHEEVITRLVKAEVSSYRQLPLILYQIQTKFRDEIRPRSGVLRSSEFIMKDAYSFDVDRKGLDRSYKKMYEAYCRILKRCGLPYTAVQADPGVMGGYDSAEFMVLSDTGEDIIVRCTECGYSSGLTLAKRPRLKSKAKDIRYIDPGDACPECGKSIQIKRGIEVGHVFKLGTRYSSSFGATFLDKGGRQKTIIMGCYGIGINRIVAATIEISNDRDGIIWPVSLSPYEVEILLLNPNSAKSKEAAGELYNDMLKEGIEVLLDDRDERAGVKFKDADLIGIPVRVIVGDKALGQGKVELEARKDEKATPFEVDQALEAVKKNLDRLKKAL